MITLTDEEFESAIQDALDTIPEEFLDELENVAIVMADEPEEEDFECDGYYTEEGDLLERLGLNRADTLEEIRTTVVHEIAHYFGMDEDQVDEMGYA